MATENKKLTNKEKIIFSLIGKMTYGEISKASEIDSKNLARYLKLLLNENEIEKIEEGRNSYYQRTIKEIPPPEPVDYEDDPKPYYLWERLAEIVENSPNQHITRIECVNLHGFKSRHISRIAAQAIKNNRIESYRYANRVHYKAKGSTSLNPEQESNKNLSQFQARIKQIPILMEFIRYLKKTKRRKNSTVYNYARIIIQLLNFKTKRIGGFNPVQVNALTQHYIDEFIESLGKYTEGSQCTRMAAITVFLQFCMKKSYIKEDFTEDFDYPNIPEKRMPDLTTKDFDKMTKAARCERDKVILQFAIFEGMRVSEIAACNVEDLNFEEQHLFIEGDQSKGRKNRTIPIPKGFIPTLKHYIELIRNPFGNENALFTTNSGRRLRKRTIEDIIKNMRRDAKIEKKITPHSCRRACARWLYERGLDILSIQYILGHKNVTQTQKYINITQQFVDSGYQSAVNNVIDDLDVIKEARNLARAENPLIGIES